MGSTQTDANITLEKALRRANLLAAATEVSQNISHITDIDELLPKTVDIICDAYDFYYAGVFLVDNEGEFAVLRAGRGEPGRIMMENNHKLAVGGNSMIGAATALNEARISLDVDTEKVWYPNPVLPETRSEMALPLAIGDKVIGAVTVQSTEEAAFSDEDISSLQAMANQLAIAIENANQRRMLVDAHNELIRTKTYEAIATATSDAIHWIGNKSEPIRSSVKRIQDDLQTLLCAIADALVDAPEGIKANPVVDLLMRETENVHQNNPDMEDMLERIKRFSPKRLARHLSISSVQEDLQIIDEAAVLIQQIKEELIGPAREQAPRPAMVSDVFQDAISGLGLPEEIKIETDMQNDLPLVMADPLQLNRVFVNLLKNAYEAMDEQSSPLIKVRTRLNATGHKVVIEVEDNGVGIEDSRQDKIWISFHTTKGLKGHAGLGLSACRLIMEQVNGEISVESELGKGSTFTVELPAYTGKEVREKGELGEGKILIIDDKDGWCQFAVETLETHGYTVDLCDDAYKAEDYGAYNLILFDDILMNAESGKVLTTVRESGAINKALGMTSNPRVERTKDRKLLGVFDLLPKPYTQADLLNNVKSTVELFTALSIS
ncbi:ATP-binding protein [Anaerolineales bacterium HSG6]|nr:ATP-binding protein [Anaerolineales bacterium HSG6]MDM8532532.1 ATP-binding protein [Anaerolineales bacterium HSG25]